MNRRRLLLRAGTVALLPFLGRGRAAWATANTTGRKTLHRVRPSDPSWPDAASWERLNREVGGQLIKVESPLAACARAPNGTECADAFKALRNPYYIGDEVGLTQTLGWAGGWTSQPSAYAVAARSTEDVVTAVNFARENKLRLVVKGGGHSYQGTSNAADSLLIWTRNMHAVTLHDAFVGNGCAGREDPQQAVTVEAGAVWMHVYDAVTTKAGRYVQGGGCATVGVAGLIQSGGFGSFSKNYGLAAAGLLEAEIVTADGAVRIANSCTNSDLFWGLKGGGGGSLGVVTRLTLRTRDLPQFFGAVSATIKANSDADFRRLIGEAIRFYSESLFNPHWGEQIIFRRGNIAVVKVLFQGLNQSQAEQIWRPFFGWVAASPGAFSILSPPMIVSVPARKLWDAEFLRKLPETVAVDDRPGAPQGNVFWFGDSGEVGQFLHAYQSAWLPASLLREDQQTLLGDALFAATRHWNVALHFNKGLAGAPAEALAEARETAMNPIVLEAFALAISASRGPPASPGVSGYEPDLSTAREGADAVEGAMGALRKLLPEVGSYVSEGNFFDSEWQRSYWGVNYPRLLAVKEKYDPDGLFFVHHGVGSEHWSADGFSRVM